MLCSGMQGDVRGGGQRQHNRSMMSSGQRETDKAEDVVRETDTQGRGRGQRDRHTGERMRSERQTEERTR